MPPKRANKTKKVIELESDKAVNNRPKRVANNQNNKKDNHVPKKNGKHKIKEILESESSDVEFSDLKLPALESPSRILVQIKTPVKDTPQSLVKFHNPSTNGINQEYFVAIQQKINAEKKVAKLELENDLLQKDLENLRSLTAAKLDSEFEDYKRSTEERNKIYQELIESLKIDLHSEREKNKILSEEIKSESMKFLELEQLLKRKSPKKEQNCDDLIKKINLYKMLTNLKVTPIVENNEVKYACLLKNNNGAVEFILEKTENKMIYKPTNTIGNSVFENLPDYFKDDIEFDITHLPKLLGKLIQHIQ